MAAKSSMISKAVRIGITFELVSTCSKNMLRKNKSLYFLPTTLIPEKSSSLLIAIPNGYEVKTDIKNIYRKIIVSWNNSFEQVDYSINYTFSLHFQKKELMFKTVPWTFSGYIIFWLSVSYRTRLSNGYIFMNSKYHFFFSSLQEKGGE